mmetsp:Transcript_23843/g.59649  ORF Transcript_23843/g.59649 Transcript_23843/m.59649 type:complete len:259 (+) Transcript_23843:145-921(+)
MALSGEPTSGARSGSRRRPYGNLSPVLRSRLRKRLSEHHTDRHRCRALSHSDELCRLYLVLGAARATLSHGLRGSCRNDAPRRVESDVWLCRLLGTRARSLCEAVAGKDTRQRRTTQEALEETLNYIFKRAKQLQCDIRPVIAKLSTDYTEHLVGASRQLYHKNGLLTASNSAYAVRRLQHSEVIRLETGVRPAAAAPAASTSSSSRTPSVDETAEVEAEENEEDEEDVHPGNEGGSRASGLPKANRGHRGMLKRMGM